MTPGLTSIVIPAYNHAALLPDAIESALAQTARVEVIVVDDGSTDDTAAVLERYAGRLKVHLLEHGGPSKARNRGLESAAGEFVMFLDADDVIAPTKVERQLAAFTPEVGWVLCDVRIEDAGKGAAQLASDRYGYKQKKLGGWIAPLLEPSNFIPIMSPLVRLSAVADIRFAETVDGEPEDWRFWQKVARVARVRYLPEVLATYRKQRTGRNRLPKAARAVVPNIVQPLRLNLGCGTPNTRSWHPIEGMVNLDKSLGWRFEDGLGQFIDRSVAGITISHALMYLATDRWPGFFSEVARVLAPGGVVRITEDDTGNPESRTYGKGWQGSEPAVTLTSALMVAHHIEAAGLQAHVVDAETTRYRDRSLMQAQHGAPPDVFFVEGVKLEGVLFSPHNDDEVLWSAGIILRHRPRVVVCYGSAGDYGDSAVREAESRDACSVLGAASFEQWAMPPGDLTALVGEMRRYDERIHPARIWAPDPQASHPDHIAVAAAAAEVFAGRLSTFHTYDANGKVRAGTRVEFEPEWTEQKLRALARYTSQIRHPRANQWFMNDLYEWEGSTR